jgi:hypothetical protein
MPWTFWKKSPNKKIKSTKQYQKLKLFLKLHSSALNNLISSGLQYLRCSKTHLSFNIGVS